MSMFEDLSGKTFGKWTVLRLGAPEQRGRRTWVCLCACGVEKQVAQLSLRQGRSKSCGCAAGTHLRTHGLSRTPIYRVWTSMIERCCNTKHRAYARYGGRGITVCAEWRASFEYFAKDMGPRPSSEHSIDRINNDEGYNPGNCRWTSAKQQQRNRRSLIYVELDGRLVCVAEAAEHLNLNVAAVYRNIREKRMSPEAALGIEERGGK